MIDFIEYMDNDPYDLMFARNVRVSLGNTPVNRAIKETFIDHPEQFAYSNNGLTLLCERATHDPARTAGARSVDRSRREGVLARVVGRRHAGAGDPRDQAAAAAAATAARAAGSAAPARPTQARAPCCGGAEGKRLSRAGPGAGGRGLGERRAGQELGAAGWRPGSVRRGGGP